ncbi:MAG: hypothetical protein Q9169_002160 [Polycauliona sp. 2 TL-2023]
MVSIPVVHTLDLILHVLSCELGPLTAQTATTYSTVRFTSPTGTFSSPEKKRHADNITVTGLLAPGDAVLNFHFLITTPATSPMFQCIISGDKGALKMEGKTFAVQTKPPRMYIAKHPDDNGPKGANGNEEGGAVWNEVEVPESKLGGFGGVAEIYKGISDGKGVEGEQHVPLIRVVHATNINRSLSHSMSPERWTFCGIATGEEASFPSATYLKKRYKRLQRRIVSRVPSLSPASDARNAGTVEVPDSPSSPGGLDPSFQAIRALNGRWDPDVIHAITKDLDGNLVGRNASAVSRSTEEAYDTHDSLASSSRGVSKVQSFRTRVDRLMKAIHRRQRIRYEPSEDGENVDIFISSANGSETGSQRSVTDQIAALPHNFGRIIPPRLENFPQIPESPRSVDEFFCPVTCAGRRKSITQAPNSGATSPAPSDGGFTTVRVGSPIITEDERRRLEERICEKIAASVGGSPNTSSRGDRGDDTISVLGRNQCKQDPKQLRTISEDGEEGCHTISPIRLDYRRNIGFTTPSLERGSSSELSSPLNRKAKIFPLSVGQIIHPDDSFDQTSPVATTDAWVSTDSGAPSSEHKGAELQSARQQKSARVFSWLHRLNDALNESDPSPTKNLGRAVNVLREGPVDAAKSAQKHTPHSAMALKDVTNLRQPGYLLSNSFTQAKRRDKLWGKSVTRKQQNGAPAQTAAPQHATTGSTRTTAGSENSSGPSTVMERSNYREQDTQYTLARLEGRAPPRPTSPFPIRRSRDDDSPYGSDVEVELPPSDLLTPQPLRPDHESVVGSWTAPMEEAVG